MSSYPKPLVLEGNYARYYHKVHVDKSRVRDKTSFSSEYRYLITARAPKDFWECLLLWDTVVTYGPGTIYFSEGNYDHFAPYDLQRSIDNNKSIPSWKGADSIENSLGWGILTIETILNALQSGYTERFPHALPLGSKRRFILPDSWRLLNLDRNFLYCAVSLCVNGGKTVFSRFPMGLTSPVEGEDGSIIAPWQTNDQWKQVQENIIDLLKGRIYPFEHRPLCT